MCIIVHIYVIIKSGKVNVVRSGAYWVSLIVYVVSGKVKVVR